MNRTKVILLACLGCCKHLVYFFTVTFLLQPPWQSFPVTVILPHFQNLLVSLAEGFMGPWAGNKGLLVAGQSRGGMEVPSGHKKDCERGRLQCRSQSKITEMTTDRWFPDFQWCLLPRLMMVLKRGAYAWHSQLSQLSWASLEVVGFCQKTLFCGRLGRKLIIFDYPEYSLYLLFSKETPNLGLAGPDLC